MSFRLILIGVTIGCLAGGCAQQNPGPAPTVTAQPTPEELPQIPELVRRGTVNVVVQGRTVAPRAALVPDFTLPELTREERLVMGERVVDYKFLPYNNVARAPDSTAGPWLGGVSTFSHGRAGALIWHDAPSRIAGSYGWGGPVTASDPQGARTWGVFGPHLGVSLVGPRDPIVIETDPQAARVAERRRYIDP